MNNIKLIKEALQILEEDKMLMAEIKELLDQKDKLNIQLQVNKLLYGSLED